MSKEMEASIIKAMNKNGKNGVSFVQLERDVENFSSSDIDWHVGDSNILIWTRVSEDFVETMVDLIKRDIIEMAPSPPLVYYVDGTILKMPLAKSIKKKYKRPHWLPVTFKLND